jgi:hypothetical protein
MKNQNNMAQQTAIEWLINHWKKLQSEGEKMNWSQIIQITELAKEMEKQQHSETWHDSRENTCIPFEDYYTKTYTTRLQNETN